MIPLVNRCKKFWGEIVAGCIGVLFFLYFWGEILDPTYVEWAVISSRDIFQHYIGWLFYKDNPLSFPVGIMKDLGYPVGIPILYTDSIPIAAFIFKILSPLFPAQFQYFGIWVLLSFILQGIFGYKLAEKIFDNRLAAIISSLFFIVSPIMISRIAHHVSLVSHWLILAGLYLVVNYRAKFPLWSWVVVELLTVVIHPYFLFMIIPVMLAHIWEIYSLKGLNFVKVLSYLFIQAGLVVLLSYSTGVFYIGSSSDGGLGNFSMNLTALFNPFWQEWSRLLPAWSAPFTQREGFNYLGAGILFLLPISLSLYVYHFSVREIFDHLKQYWCYYLAALGLTLFAISPHIRWGKITLIDIKIPIEMVKKMLATFRSSGRFFWPVYYSLFLVALYGLQLAFKRYSKLLIITLVSICSLQMYDLSAHLIKFEQPKYEQEKWQLSLPDRWQNIKQNYEHISFIPHEPFAKQKNSNFPDIMVLAALNDITVNTTYFSRTIKGKNKHIEKQINALTQGKSNSETVYIITKNKDNLTDHKKESDLLVEQKNYTLFAPNYYQKIEQD